MPQKEKRCPQCYQYRKEDLFVSSTGQAVLWCAYCRSKYKGPSGYEERASEPRRGLPVYSDRPPLVRWSAQSGNEKLGPIPVALVSAETCPNACPFKGRGCYHEFGFMGWHWREVAKDGISWDEFLKAVSELPEGQLWRYASGGDLPGVGNELDIRALVSLVAANRGRKGFTFTHKPMDAGANQSAIAYSNQEGFTVNLSADSLIEADELADLGIAPVVVVLPTNAREDVRTPAGRKVLVCLHETKGLTCDQCKLCSRPERKSIIGFRAHGQMAATVSKIVGDQA